MKNHERELPYGYNEAYRIDATDKKAGIIMNVVAFSVMALIIISALIPVFVGAMKFEKSLASAIAMPVGVAVGIPLYMLLHELVHGLGYKLMTRERLKFGMSWSCAYCGVPDIYVYRRTSLIAVTLPLLLFTLVFTPLVVMFSFVNTYLYFAFVLLLAVHLGGCVGDMYVAALLLFKYRSPYTLVRDTGPEQIFYEKKKNAKKRKKKS